MRWAMIENFISHIMMEVPSLLILLHIPRERNRKGNIIVVEVRDRRRPSAKKPTKAPLRRSPEKMKTSKTNEVSSAEKEGQPSMKVGPTTKTVPPPPLSPIRETIPSHDLVPPLWRIHTQEEGKPWDDPNLFRQVGKVVRVKKRKCTMKLPTSRPFRYTSWFTGCIFKICC